MPIRIDHERRVVLLGSATTSYVFAADPAGLLRHLYWGPRIDRLEDFEAPALWDLSSNDPVVDITAEEYPIHGSFRSTETCLTVRFADGSREVRAVVDSMTASADTAVVTLADERGLRVELHYRVLPDTDLLQRWAVVTNTGAGPLVVTELASAQFHLPREGLRVWNVAGHWGAEQRPFQQELGPGKVVLEARKGISTHHHNPYLLVDRGATETAGEVWFAALAWSGNFRAVLERTPRGGTSAQIGLNPYDSDIALGPGESVRTPTVIAGHTTGGLQEASHRMHAYARSLLDPRPRPVLYNSWEAAGFDVDVEGQIALAERAARIGAELFVVDDGWFGRRGEPDDGLGDWWVNPVKFPHGLAPLIDAVRSLGMAFGIWVEPEMVNPRSDLYAAHPEWIYRDPVRPPDTARGQYVLDLTRPDVAEHLFGVLDRLLCDHRIDYLKWDANRPLSAVGTHRDAYRMHIEALYALVARLRAAHPGVLIEACASGGGRIDMGALTVFDDVWVSDNTDAADRLTIQAGYGMVYPAKAMRAWVTDVPNFLSGRSIPLTFRARSAMLGSLGIGLDLVRATESELDELAGHIEVYKRLRPLVHEGRMYRLANDTDNDYRFTGYVDAAAGRAVLFAFLLSSRVGHRKPRVRMRGLDPHAVYRFKANHIRLDRSGAHLMNHGLDLWLQGDYDSQIVEFTALT